MRNAILRTTMDDEPHWWHAISEKKKLVGVHCLHSTRSIITIRKSGITEMNALEKFASENALLLLYLLIVNYLHAIECRP